MIPRRSLASDQRAKRCYATSLRYQVQGPNAAKVLEKLTGDRFPTSIFTMDASNIKGRKVRALRHGMAGAPAQIWGPYARADEYATRSLRPDAS